MPFSEGQKKEIENHIPTVKRNCEVFLRVFIAEMDQQHDEDKAIFLKEMIDVMETHLAEVKTILQTQILDN